MKKALLLICTGLLLFGCDHDRHAESALSKTENPELLFLMEDALTEAIIQDGFSPPVASRIYAYCNLTAQMVVSSYDEDGIQHAEALNGFEDFEGYDTVGTDRDLVMVLAFSLVAKELVYRDHIIDSVSTGLQESVLDLSNSTRQQSFELARKVSNYILKRAKSDGYAESRSLPRYKVKKGPDKWEPTPPGYTDALEPHWSSMKPFTLDSAGQFFIPFDFKFSSDSTSGFYQIATEVYDSVNTYNKEYTLIAKFWDCNPFLTKQEGHLMYHVRQLTPGGHWMEITETACRKSNLSLSESANLLAKVSIAVADGFISAWHSKYKTDFIRPETYINRYIDAEWMPILESPHFPEYTSAHSTISAAAATVLTDYFGERYSFTDSSEVPFGLPPRDFDSFFQASNEAGLSRLLGGIHFRPAIEAGITQGNQVGEHVLDVVP